ncbi:MAG: transglutaminase-like domain-containing protein [Thermoproteota archaeon]
MSEYYGEDCKSRILLMSIVIALMSFLAFLSYYYIKLESEYRTLRDTIARVSSELSKTQQSYNVLFENYVTLSKNYESLEEAYRSISKDYTDLKYEYDKLYSEYEKLNSKYSSTLKEKEKIESWYLSLRSSVNIRQGFGEEKKAFVTPNDVEVRKIVMETTGGWSDPSNWNEFWMDLEKLYNWVVNNVVYSYDSPSPVLPNICGELYWRDECYRFPNETLRQKRGDCEDQAILLASMILSYSSETCKTLVVQWVGNGVGHTAIVIQVGSGKITILDPAGRFYTSNPQGRIDSKDVKTAVEEWLTYWNKQGYSNIRIHLVFSKTLYREFLSTEEFIQWFLRSL